MAIGRPLRFPMDVAMVRLHYNMWLDNSVPMRKPSLLGICKKSMPITDKYETSGSPKDNLAEQPVQMLRAPLSVPIPDTVEEMDVRLQTVISLILPHLLFSPLL